MLLQVLRERTPVQFSDCNTENGGSKLRGNVGDYNRHGVVSLNACICFGGWNAGYFTDSEILQAVGRLLGFCNWLNRFFFCFEILLRYNVLFLHAENLLAVWVTISFSGMPVLYVVTVNIHNNQASTSHRLSLLITSLCPDQGPCPYAQCVAVFKLFHAARVFKGSAETCVI